MNKITTIIPKQNVSGKKNLLISNIMITESEKKALQLAKKVFEHFTHDALLIAREIIAMELELGEPQVIVEPSDDVKRTDVIDFPVSDISTIGLDDPEQSVKQFNEELVYQQQDDFPF